MLPSGATTLISPLAPSDALPSSSPLLEPSIVGSLPKPAWLAQPNMLRAPWRLAGGELREAQDDAVRLALLDQEEAGLAVVCDGEIAAPALHLGIPRRARPAPTPSG